MSGLPASTASTALNALNASATVIAATHSTIPSSSASPSLSAAPVPVGVLLINLGTPDAPTPQAVGRYLTEFLSDRRVVEIPAFIWQVILRLLIVPLRSRASAKKYLSVWQAGGSPLRAYTERQVQALRTRLGAESASGHGAVADQRLEVEYAMRYGQPSIATRIAEMTERGIERIVLLPMYPQYSASTTATAFDAAFAKLKTMRNQPAIRMLKDYPTHPAYIAALAEQIARYWREHGTPDFAAGDKLVLSFHGIPKRTVSLGDPYYAQCLQTGAALTAALGLDETQCQVTFQSRFGKAEWLQPYTEPTLIALARGGCRRADVFCPGFTADCLETIEEIGMEVRDAFLGAGGETFHRIACINDAPAWIAALATLVYEQTGGWVVPATQATERRAGDLLP